jgi:hypothetical protein
MTSTLSIVSLSLSVLLFINIAQADTQSINQLKKYLDAKEYKQAFVLADQLSYDLAGEVEFDFLAGLAAYGAGKYHEAVFAFERVVILQPLSFRGRYYLASSYQKVDNLGAALNELDALLDSQKRGVVFTDEQISQISLKHSYLYKKNSDLKRNFYQYITLAIGSDNNINSGSSLDNVELFDGTVIPLFDSSKAISDSTLLARYHGDYVHNINQNQSLKFDLTVQQTQYQSNSDQNRSLIDAKVSYKYRVSPDTLLNIGAGTIPFWLAGDRYITQNSVFAGWQQKITRNSNFGFNGIYADVDHHIYESLDLERYQLNTYYRYAKGVQHLFILNTYQDKNKFGLKFNNKTSVGLTYVLDYPIYQKFTGNLMLMHEQQQYDGLNTFNEYSDSSLNMIASRFSYTGFSEQVLQLQLSYQNKNVESDLASMKIYEYHRFEANVKWKYNF